MTDADKASYRKQFEGQARHLPRGHVINHCTWKDGRLTVMHAKPPKISREPEFEPRVKRGVQAGLFD